LLLLDASRRAGITPLELVRAGAAKMTWVGFCYMLRTHGVDKSISALLMGTTHPDEVTPTRGQQIRRWVDEANSGPFPVGAFVVLDDAPPGMCFKPIESRLVKTNGTRGLTEEDTDRVIAMLNK
jgi:hypothetical protein